MKKILLILLCLPMILFGQELREFNKYDIIINQVLENSVSFIKDKNTPKKEFKFYLNNQKSSIDWSDKRLSKWQIVDKKINGIKQ
jgi:hypothetical protein